MFLKNILHLHFGVSITRKLVSLEPTKETPGSKNKN